MFNAISPSVRVISSQPKPKQKGSKLERREHNDTELIPLLIRSQPAGKAGEKEDEGITNQPRQFETTPNRKFSRQIKSDITIFKEKP